METPSQTKYQKLIRMLEAFISGESTSCEFVREMEVEFWSCGLNEDDRYSDLMMALDMFGVPPEGFGCDQKQLAGDCRYALKLLREQP